MTLGLGEQLVITCLDKGIIAIMVLLISQRLLSIVEADKSRKAYLGEIALLRTSSLERVTTALAEYEHETKIVVYEMLALAVEHFEKSALDYTEYNEKIAAILCSRADELGDREGDCKKVIWQERVWLGEKLYRQAMSHWGAVGALFRAICEEKFDEVGECEKKLDLHRMDILKSFDNVYQSHEQMIESELRPGIMHRFDTDGKKVSIGLNRPIRPKIG